jgi:small subunit ribosomal protein S14
MKNKIKIDTLRRNLFYKNEINKNLLKFLAYNTNNSLKNRWIYILKLSAFKSNSVSSRIHNFCVMTGRSKSVLKNFKISRLVFRDKASFSKIIGITKSSW